MGGGIQGTEMLACVFFSPRCWWEWETAIGSEWRKHWKTLGMWNKERKGFDKGSLNKQVPMVSNGSSSPGGPRRQGRARGAPAPGTWSWHSCNNTSQPLFEGWSPRRGASFLVLLPAHQLWTRKCPSKVEKSQGGRVNCGERGAGGGGGLKADGSGVRCTCVYKWKTNAPPWLQFNPMLFVSLLLFILTEFALCIYLFLATLHAGS